MLSRAACALALVATAASEAFPEGLRQGIRFHNATDVELRLAENRQLLDKFLLRNGTSNSCEKGLLNVAVCYQICDNWCWATVTTMTVDYYKGESTCLGRECQMPTREFGQQCCPYTNSCQNSPSDPQTICNSGGTPPQMADAANYFTGGPFKMYGVLDQATLDGALMSNRVVMICVYWQGGGGHALIIGGCGGGTYYLHDPWGWYSPPPPQWQALTYAGLLQYVAPNGGVGAWTYSVTWALDDEEGHASALRAAAEIRARSKSVAFAV